MDVVAKERVSIEHGDPVHTKFIVGRQPPGRDKMWEVDILFPKTLQGEADICAIDEGSADLLYGLVRCLKPHRVLETGTHKGRSTKAICQALAANGYGEMITIDADDYKTLRDALTDEELSRCHQVVGKCPEILQDLEGMFGPVVFDLAFLDGDHTGETLLKEVEFVKAHSAKECWIVIDNSRDAMWPEVREACDHLRYNGDHIISLEAMCGIDIIHYRRKDDGKSEGEAEKASNGQAA